MCAIIAKSKGNTPRELTPAGNYSARCYQMIHIGTNNETFKGETKIMNKVWIGWEIPELTRVFDEAKGPQPIVISKEYTLSLGTKANLRKMLASWRSRDFTEEEAEAFDITAVLGKACMINVIHKASESDATKVYEEIAGVTPLPTGLKCPPLINPLQELTFDAFNRDLFEKLPEFIRDKIRSSEEYRAMMDPEHVGTDNQEAGDPDDDDLPF